MKTPVSVINLILQEENTTENKEIFQSIGEENEKIFGLNFQKDTIRFVTWNAGRESFRDMQLMAACRHNIFTESTFGFWGAYLNENPDKITCAPDPTILATNWF